MPMSPRLLRPIAARATSIDPASVAGLYAWWDAADATTVTLDSGRVSELADKSGAGRNLANTTSGSTQPDYITAGRNGRNVIRFAAASSQRLLIAGFSTFNFVHDGNNAFIAGVFAPGGSANPNSLNILFANGLAGQVGLTGHACYYDDRSFTNDAFGFSIANGTANVCYVLAPNRMPAQQAAVFRLTIDADNATSANRVVGRINSDSVTSGGTATPSASSANRSLYVGCNGNANNFLTGDFCELMFYNQHPTQAHQDALFSYLARKWGVAV